MLYPKLSFTKAPKDRPFFYTNFVSSVDGKVSVNKPGYWPIGSKKDYQTLLELRSYADCLIHGGQLGRQFGETTIKSIGKTSPLPYYIVTKHPKSLSHLKGKAVIYSGNLQSLVKVLSNKGYRHVLVEGGPTLLGSFFKMGLIDEIFLTIAPKIFGSKPNTTKTLVEGILLPSNKFKLKLLSVKQIADELFLRYKLRP